MMDERWLHASEMAVNVSTATAADESFWLDRLPDDVVNHIYGYVLAMQLSKPSRRMTTLKMLLDSQFCIIMPGELFQAVQHLAAHLGVPYNRPGPEEEEEKESMPVGHRLFRDDDHGSVCMEGVFRFPRPTSADNVRTKSTRCWLLEAMDLSDTEFYNASLRSLEFLGACPRDLRRRGGARAAFRRQVEWDARVDCDHPGLRNKKIEYK